MTYFLYDEKRDISSRKQADDFFSEFDNPYMLGIGVLLSKKDAPINPSLEEIHAAGIESAEEHCLVNEETSEMFPPCCGSMTELYLISSEETGVQYLHPPVKGILYNHPTNGSPYFIFREPIDLAVVFTKNSHFFTKTTSAGQ